MPAINPKMDHESCFRVSRQVLCLQYHAPIKSASAPAIATKDSGTRDAERKKEKRDSI